MMKGIATIAIVLMGLGTATATRAQINQQVERVGQDKRIEINVEDLPTSVSKELATSHSGASVMKAYKWENEKGDIIGYEVLLKTEAGEQTVKYGPNGEPAK